MAVQTENAGKVVEFIKVSAAQTERLKARNKELEEQLAKIAAQQQTVADMAKQAATVLVEHDWIGKNAQARAEQQLTNPAVALETLIKVAQRSQPAAPPVLGEGVAVNGAAKKASENERDLKAEYLDMRSKRHESRSWSQWDQMLDGDLPA